MSAPSLSDWCHAIETHQVSLLSDVLVPLELSFFLAFALFPAEAHFKPIAVLALVGITGNENTQMSHASAPGFISLLQGGLNVL